jgi:chaperonin GroEL
VIDPTKVTKTALQNAASIAALILTTDCSVAEIKRAEPSQPQGGMPGMM